MDAAGRERLVDALVRKIAGYRQQFTLADVEAEAPRAVTREDIEGALTRADGAGLITPTMDYRGRWPIWRSNIFGQGWRRR